MPECAVPTPKCAVPWHAWVRSAQVICLCLDKATAKRTSPAHNSAISTQQSAHSVPGGLKRAEAWDALIGQGGRCRGLTAETCLPWLLHAHQLREQTLAQTGDLRMQQQQVPCRQLQRVKSTRGSRTPSHSTLGHTACCLPGRNSALPPGLRDTQPQGEVSESCSSGQGGSPAAG